MTDFLQIATDLTNRGFSVIPIEPRGKRPLAGWGVTRRLRNSSFIDVPTDCNVGICADENIVILETDDLERLNTAIRQGAGHPLPATLTACGSSENRPHFFFKRTEKATNVGNLVLPGLFEARFSNQYVVGVGSVHPSGAIYRWINDVPIVPVPDWLVSELVRLALSQKTLPDRTRTIETVAGRVPEGSRHYFLMRELGRLWSGDITEDELLEKAFELNQQCDPPKDTAHVIQCVRDIMRRTPFDPGPKVIIGSSVQGVSLAGRSLDGSEVVPRSGSTPGMASLGFNSSSLAGPLLEWTAQSAKEISAAKYEEREPIITEGDGVLFYERSVNQVVAWRGVGKTMLALALAGAMGAGSCFLDFSVPKPRRVLYLDGELPLAQLQERVRALIAPEAQENVHLFNPEMLEQPRGLNLVSAADSNALLRLTERLKIEVLILDSQSTLMYGDSIDSRFQEQRQDVLRQLRWQGLCIIEMHHLGKGGLQRGSSKNDDILDVQVKMNRVMDWEPEDGLLFELSYEKVRHAARLESNYEVTFTDGKWIKQTSTLVQKVADLWRANKTDRQIAKELDITKSRANRLKHKASTLGLIELNEKTEDRKGA